MKNFDKIHWTIGLAPVADAYSGTVYSDVVKVSGEGMGWIRIDGVGLLGTSTITVEACDDVTPTNSTAVAFMYKISTTPDTWGTWTQATTTGFTTTAGSNQVYSIYVDASECAAEGYAYARLKMVEVANDPVVGCVLQGVVTPNYNIPPATLLT